MITGHLIPAGTGTELMQSIRLKYLGQEIEPELPTQEPGERSVEEIAAAWRDSDLKDDAAVDFGDDGDSLPDEAHELLPETGDDGFGELDTDFGDEPSEDEF